MAEQIRDSFDVGARFKPTNRRRMAQGVNADARMSGLLGCRFDNPQQVSGVDGGAKLGGEHQAAIGPLITGGYDLLCELDGKCWHIEVKGTTQAPKSVLVSPNEVSFALAHPQTAVLFVLSNIVITKPDGVALATGGVPLPIEPWEVQMERLSATGYTYALDGLT